MSIGFIFMLSNTTVIMVYVGTASVMSDVLLVNSMAFAFGSLHLLLTGLVRYACIEGNILPVAIASKLAMCKGALVR